MNEPALLLHAGRLAHLRHTPFRHFFAYRMWMLSADLDRLGGRQSRLCAYNRWGVLSLHDRDHGPRDGAPLGPWARAALADSGLAEYGAQIRFMAIPRVCGWAFNPIAFFFCRDAAGTLGAVIHQVKNTFGGQHAYVLPVSPPAVEMGQIRQDAAKRLHVSPFFDMNGGYRFAFRTPVFQPGGRFDLTLRYGDAQTPRLTATLHLRGVAASLRNMLALLIQQPLMPVKVMVAIHWQALRLWRRGATFHPAPARDAAPAPAGHRP